MAKLVIHTNSGDVIAAPIEAWIVALITSLPGDLARRVFTNVARMDGASIVPDKYLIGEDALGTITIVERPLVDLGGKI